MTITREKRSLRTKIRQDAEKLTQAEMTAQAREVFDRIEKTELFSQAANIAFFWSMSDEIPTHATIRKWAPYKNIFLPVLVGGSMSFARYDPDKGLSPGPYNIPEPAEGRAAAPGELDLIIVPGLAFDKNGWRLGRGKGYYDTFLAGTAIPTIGVCFRHQIVDRVPTEPYDHKVDSVFYPE